MEHTAAPLRPRTARPVNPAQSLQRRILLRLMAAVTILVLVILAGVVVFTLRAEQEAWSARQAEAAQSAAQSVARFIQGISGELKQIGAVERRTLAADPAVLNSFLDENAALLEVVRLDQNGDVIDDANRGEVVLANLFTIPQSRWFLTAREGKAYFGDVRISASDVPYLITAVPAADSGVVAARVDMKLLWEVVGDIRFGRSGSAYVVDAAGRILAHTDPQVVLANTMIAGRTEFEALSAAPDRSWAGSYTNFEGRRVVGVTAPLPGTEWTIVTELPRAEAYATTRTALILLGGVLSVLATGILFASTRFARRAIFAPIEALRVGAERLGQGELSYRVEVVRDDEIGQAARAFNEMSRRLRERTQQLTVARRQAEEASRIKSEFLSTMSHELRTPLNAIIGFTEIMLAGMGGQIDADARHMTERVHENSRRLLALINDVLDLAKIEARRVEIVARPVPLVELLEGVVERMESLAAQKGLEVGVQVDPRLPSYLMADEAHLERILINLISNAVKFTEKGRVDVSAARISDTEWTLAVKDTGIGIPPHAQEYIFDPFRQVDGSSQRAYQGTGLGLAITRELVRAMGGTIRVDSAVGRGSTFTVSLPMQEVSEAEEEMIPA